MPLPKGTRYRVKQTPKGPVRLAFNDGVIEAKNLKTGATHTPGEFAADRAAGKRRRRERNRAFGG